MKMCETWNAIIYAVSPLTLLYLCQWWSTTDGCRYPSGAQSSNCKIFYGGSYAYSAKFRDFSVLSLYNDCQLIAAISIILSNMSLVNFSKQQKKILLIKWLFYRVQLISMVVLLCRHHTDIQLEIQHTIITKLVERVQHTCTGIPLLIFRNLSLLNSK